MRKTRFMLPFLALLATAGALPASASPAGTDVHGDWPHNRTFQAISLTDHGHARAIVPGTTIRVTFGATDHVSAHAGCNSGSASGRVVAHRLVLSGLVTTRMACAPARMAQDAFLAGVLTSRPVFLLTGHSLTLRNGRSQVHLVEVS
jgi:heat shock protein HslJ